MNHVRGLIIISYFFSILTNFRLTEYCNLRNLQHFKKSAEIGQFSREKGRFGFLLRSLHFGSNRLIGTKSPLNREFVLCLERGSWENRHSGSTTENCK